MQRWATLALYFATLTRSQLLFEGGTVLAFDNTTERINVLRNASVLVVENRIAKIFETSADNATIPEGTERINVQGGIVSPGFIDTHKHGWQTALRTIGSNTTLAEYFNRYGEFAVAPFTYTPEDVYYGQLIGIYESLNAGVTGILDHAHHTWSVATSAAGVNASIESGARVWWCYALHELTNNFTVPEQLDNIRALATDQRWENSPASLGIAFDGINTATDEHVKEVFDLATNISASAITLHQLGGPWGYDNSPELVNSKGYLNISIPIVFSHSSFLSSEGMQLLRDTNQHVSITPESEMHYGHDHPRSWEIQDQAALGVDTHFTFSTDIVTQARLWLQSTRLRLFKQRLDNNTISRNSPMSAHQAFLLSTRSGGLALHRDDIGVLREGAVADLVVFDGDSPNLVGWDDPIAAIILHSHVGNVKHVVVDGKFKKRDGELVVDGEGGWEGLKARFLESARRIQQVFKETPFPDLQGEFRPGVPYVDAVTVDVVRGDSNGY